MRKLDVFNHIWPTRFYEALRAHTSGPMQDITRRSEAVPMMTQLDVRFRVMDLFGPDYQQILSLASPLLDLATNAEQGRRLARTATKRRPSYAASTRIGFPASRPRLPCTTPRGPRGRPSGPSSIWAPVA